ncbi:MAG: aminodeoxychorismate synthase component I [Pseudomonadota bacterium]
MLTCCTQLEGRRDLLELHEAAPDRYPFLLESVASGTPDARYDMLFLASGGSLALPATASGSDAARFLSWLDQWTRRSIEEQQQVLGDERPHDLPFLGGWFLHLGYEVGRGIESVLEALPDARTGFPQALAVRCPAALVFDHHEQQTYAVAETPFLLARLEADYRAPGPVPHDPDSTCALREADAAPFLSAVDRVKSYILAGDVFQANISRAWEGPCVSTPSALYRRLRKTNPAPFAGLAVWGDSAIVSSSPERLVRIDGLDVQTRPIAGTFPRAAEPRADEELKRQLLAHPKEQAEHVMLIDLERNDLGRVCQPGSINVEQFMTTETYARVHHLVSAVHGRLRPEVSPVDVIRAVFPGGTITGCPKVRCMEIIGELEGVGRGPYTGSMGYLCRSGHMDVNILIRSFHLSDQRLSLRAGAGIVADSQPTRELEETRHKASGLLASLKPTSANQSCAG